MCTFINNTITLYYTKYDCLLNTKPRLWGDLYLNLSDTFIRWCHLSTPPQDTTTLYYIFIVTYILLIELVGILYCTIPLMLSQYYRLYM